MGSLVCACLAILVIRVLLRLMNVRHLILVKMGPNVV